MARVAGLAHQNMSPYPATYHSPYPSGKKGSKKGDKKGYKGGKGKGGKSITSIGTYR